MVCSSRRIAPATPRPPRNGGTADMWRALRTCRNPNHRRSRPHRSPHKRLMAVLATHARVPRGVAGEALAALALADPGRRVGAAQLGGLSGGGIDQERAEEQPADGSGCAGPQEALKGGHGSPPAPAPHMPRCCRPASAASERKVIGSSRWGVWQSLTRACGENHWSAAASGTRSGTGW